MDKDKAIEAYQQAINQIDDYFERDSMKLFGERGKSFEDCQKRVHEVLAQLTKKLSELSVGGLSSEGACL